MTQPFLALITPVSLGGGGWDTFPKPTPQPPVYPSHPIYYPPYPDQGLPGHQPYPDQGLPGSQPRPDQGLPGPQPRPEHPIYFPPPGQPPLGFWGPPDMPPGFWGGGMGPGVKPQPKPEHPIVLPPDLPPTIPPEGGQPERPIDWRVGWTAQTGWIVVGVPQFVHPAPSK